MVYGSKRPLAGTFPEAFQLVSFSYLIPVSASGLGLLLGERGLALAFLGVYTIEWSHG